MVKDLSFIHFKTITESFGQVSVRSNDLERTLKVIGGTVVP